MPKSNFQPNIVFMVLDTHRRDRLGMYGYRRGTSPNLDAFARTATVFENAVSPAQWTIPSHASMFSGEYPSTHLTTQSADMLDPAFRTLAQWLGSNGYRRTGFCNNPLVGVLGNGLKRGFETFYNYGGAVPSMPARSTPAILKPLSMVWERYTQLLRKISYPVQNAVARSEKILHMTLNPLLVPLWTKYANFKGDTRRSLEDAGHFVEKCFTAPGKTPHFLFINVMETHLPFGAPEPFVTKFAPLMRAERAARDFMRVYNTQAMRWLLPMEEPFSALEAETLSQMYDAEVAYQDHLLGSLLEKLDSPYHRENTAVIIVADHGELLGEHSLMGHGLSVFQDLINVPLIVRLPGQTQSGRVGQAVSTAHLFHTVLDLAKAELPLDAPQASVPFEKLSLARMITKGNPAPVTVFSEAYPAANVTSLVRQRFAHLEQPFDVTAIQRAAYNQELLKLIQVEDVRETLYNVRRDPLEANPISDEITRQQLSQAVALFVDAARSRQPLNWTRTPVGMEDEALVQRMRSLGYIE